jgi:WD40 repeat protein
MIYVNKLQGHKNRVTQIKIIDTNSDKQIISSSMDNTIIVWRVQEN